MAIHCMAARALAQAVERVDCSKQSPNFAGSTAVDLPRNRKDVAVRQNH